VTADIAKDDRAVGELEVQEFLGDAAGISACYCGEVLAGVQRLVLEDMGGHRGRGL
jgi:hypothetical protein